VRQRPGLTPEQRAMALRLRARGFKIKEIGEQIDVSKSSALNAVTRLTARSAEPLSWTPGPGRLVFEEREEISLGLHRGASLTSIAGGLGRSLSTVSREVAANGGRCGYRAWRAHQRPAQRSRRPKTQKLATPELATQVNRWQTAPAMALIMKAALPRAFTMMNKSGALDPHEPHWHIGPIGVRPQLQGLGVGKTLLSAFLTTIDEVGEPAFLETDVERNVELYESFGFVVTSREDIVGATTRFTWRDTTNRTGDPFHALSASDAVHRLGGGADRRRSRQRNPTDVHGAPARSPWFPTCAPPTPPNDQALHIGGAAGGHPMGPGRHCDVCGFGGFL
jgi:ribosomal protein S18 acetylase RimI-like enzyme